MTDRRKFIRHSAQFTAAGLLLPLWACGPAETDATNADVEEIDENEERAAASGGTLEAFGIQLYTLRDVFPQDVKGTLRKVADYGYKQVEGYETDRGIFWGMEPQEFKDYLDELGLTMVSTHCNIDQDFEQKAKDAASIGMDYLICPYIGPQSSKDAWQAVVDKFNDRGRICADNGLRFAYHNHGYSFENVYGIVPQDFMMEQTNDTVDYEMDIYWVVTGGADPVAYLDKYPGKWKLCHVKDRLKDAAAGEAEASTDLGTGSIDFTRILAAAQDQGMEYYIVEQERYDNGTSLEAAEVDAAYLRELKFG